MTLVMLSDGSAADAYVEQDLGSDQSELWVTVGMFFDTASLAQWLALGSPNLIKLFSAGHANGNDSVFVESGPPNWATGWGSFGGTPVGATWQDCEFHHVTSGVTELYVGGVLVSSGVDGSGFDTRFVRIGQADSSDTTPSLAYFRAVKIGTTRGGSELFADDFSSGNLSAWTTAFGAVSVVADPAPPPTPTRRFANGTRARMVVTDLAGTTTTWLDKILLEGTILAQLNLPWQITGAVRSGDPRVNAIFPADGDPLVAQSNRLVYVFLRDGPPETPWTCRASGILMSPQDQGDSDTGTTHFTAYDPWQYLFALPCFLDGSGSFIGPLPRLFNVGQTGAEIALQLLGDTISSIQTLLGIPGFTSFIDAGVSYGGTPFYTGTIEATPIFHFSVQQGTTLGDAWNALIAAGDPSGGAGGMDIVLEPIYDRVNRPGYLSQLSIYNLAGVDRRISPMAWGRFARTAITADRQHDGTPGNFVNVANFYAADGTRVPIVGPPPENAASVAAYGPYWQTQFFPSQNQSDTVAAMETQALLLQKQGKRTFTLDPDPLRAASPFVNYMPGDRVPVLTGPSLRVSATGLQRVEGIPVVIGPDGITRVSQLLTTPDWRH